jgi:hypothetical protein
MNHEGDPSDTYVAVLAGLRKVGPQGLVDDFACRDALREIDLCVREHESAVPGRENVRPNVDQLSPLWRWDCAWDAVAAVRERHIGELAMTSFAHGWAFDF